MAAIDTFEWLVYQLWPRPDNETTKFIYQQCNVFFEDEKRE